MRINEKNKREKKSYYAAAFRWKLIQELAAVLITEQQACEKYGITIILIRKWRKQYYQRKIQPLLTTQPMKQKQSQSDRRATEEIKALKTKLLALEKQNKQLRLEAYAHKTMVDIAEKELNISIRKKSGPGRTADAAVSQVNQAFPTAGIERICQLFAVPLGDSQEMPFTKLTNESTNGIYKKLWCWKKSAGSKQSNPGRA